MSLDAIVDLIQAELTRRSCPHELKLGEQYIHDHSCSRFVIVPTQDSFQDPNVSAPQYFVGTREDSQLTPRPIFTRRSGMKINIWGAAPGESTDQRRRDQSYVELMLEVFLASLRTVAQGSFWITGGGFSSDQAIHDRRGLVYELQISIDVPVRDINWREESLTFAPADADTTIDTLLGDTEPQTYQPGPQFLATGS